MLKEQHRFFRSVLMAADLAIICSAAVAAYLLRYLVLGGVLPYDAGEVAYRALAIPIEVAAPLMMLAMMWAGEYRPRRDQRFYLEAAAIMKGVVAGVGATIIVLSLFKNVLFDGRHYSAWQFAIFGACSMVMLMAWRYGFRVALRMIRARGWNLRHVAIIGTGRLGRLVCRTLRRNTWTGIEPVFFISHHHRAPVAACLGLPVKGGLDDLDLVLRDSGVTGVFVAMPGKMSAWLPALVMRLERYPVDVRLVPDMNPKYMPINLAANELDGVPILSIRESPLSGWGRVAKRALDLSGGILLLLVFAVPMLIIALAIYAYGGEGPVIFRQERMSLNGRRFRIFKFRTMNHEAGRVVVQPAEGGRDAQTRAEGGRVTPIGRFLRRTSLDELPQLFNVILGDMSLVGPRPMAELVQGFRDDWRGCMLRQNVKAGITGWAQVNGLRGDTSLRKRLQYDLFYIRNWSLLFDLRILAMTVVRGFAHPNAH